MNVDEHIQREKTVSDIRTATGNVFLEANRTNKHLQQIKVAVFVAAGAGVMTAAAVLFLVGTLIDFYGSF